MDTPKPVSQITFWRIVGIGVLVIGATFSYTMRIDGKLNAYKDDIFKEIRNVSERTVKVETTVNNIEKDVTEIKSILNGAEIYED